MLGDRRVHAILPTHDVEAEVAALQARGVVFETYDAPKTVEGVARVPAGRAAWFKDPAGNLLGLIEFARSDEVPS